MADLDDLKNRCDWHDFTTEAINALVSPRRIGVYLLSVLKITPSETTIDRLGVGRSDDDVQGLLHQRLRELKEEFGQACPTLFKCEYYRTARRAFLIECELYHHHKAEGKILDRHHPPAPTDSKLRCPDCSYVGGQTTAGSGSS